jgi:hypothetical protein
VARLEKTGDVLSVFFQKKSRRHIVHPRYKLKKKPSRMGLPLPWQALLVGPDEMG